MRESSVSGSQPFTSAAMRGGPASYSLAEADLIMSARYSEKDSTPPWREADLPVFGLSRTCNAADEQRPQSSCGMVFVGRRGDLLRGGLDVALGCLRGPLPSNCTVVTAMPLAARN